MLMPETEAALAETIAAASGPLAIRGGGTRGLPLVGEVLSTAALRGVHLYEPGALTIVLAAGTPLEEVEAALAAENQRLPFEPMDHRALLGTTGTPTIGGVVAANVSGPRRIVAGAARDSLIGLRFVDGAGRIVKNGGRVMKNVTGYDLVKLLAGSYGTLGVLTEVAFKVLPRPETCATLTLTGQDPAMAVGAMARALGSPYEVNGAAHDPGSGQTWLRIEGFAPSVAYRAERLRALLGGAVQTDPEAQADLWQGIRDVRAFAGRAGDVWRISLTPSAAPDLVAQLPGETRLDWGGGLIWALLPPGHDPRPLVTAGHATLVRATTPGALPVFHPEPAPLAALAQGLRHRFDPRGILNPGLMG